LELVNHLNYICRQVLEIDFFKLALGILDIVEKGLQSIPKFITKVTENLFVP